MIDFTPIAEHPDAVAAILDPQPFIATLQDLADALEGAAQKGNPSLTDWPHRLIDLRILSHMVKGLHHPVEAFGTLLPDDWEQITPEIRDRIPGNPINNHMRLVSKFKRAIGLFRPDLDPWSALQVLADVDNSKTSPNLGRARTRALRDGMKPIDITNHWIAEQLANVAPEKESSDRAIFQFLVRLSNRPCVQQSGLLRTDLALPATQTQNHRAVTLPDWLQAICDVNDRQTHNGIVRIWRTLQHVGLNASTPDDIMKLIESGKLKHEVAMRFEPIKLGSWKTYISKTRKSLRPLVNDPSIYANRIQH